MHQNAVSWLAGQITTLPPFGGQNVNTIIDLHNFVAQTVNLSVS